MSMSTRAIARYSLDTLLKLSNPDVANTSANDVTRIGLAETDAGAEFEVMVGVVYDDNDARHVQAGVQLFILKLMEYGAVPSEVLEKQRSRAEKMLEALGNVTARDRVEPKSSSQLTPSDENPSGGVVRPAFDDPFFDQLIPNPPSPPVDPTGLD